ncbi:CocE/NonD family hydrolase C-terminal non-catalytic domain-containing protein [Saccharopolyspora gloriosae]|uniref:CocE/NonD family hydrolase C-terminal non-catalytic domain-containing protein n=1 Tax=Saccharopolyspora gloriosae TaxID=455344 RepID=UPI001FB71401|nr:CocE/NonD family hydrolase C-terminal non-catalytic domain-containing protein [Saccharopolyspora gloriosae]
MAAGAHRWSRHYLDLDTGGLTEHPPHATQAAEFTARSAGLLFALPAAEHDAEFTGPAAMTLFASSDTRDADLFVTVHLFDPDGTEVLFTGASEPNAPVSQGWLRMSHRELDPALSLPHRPWHPHTTPAPLQPHQVYEAHVEIWPLSIVVPAGYRLAVSIRGQDYTHDLAPGPLGVRGSGPFWHELPGDRDDPAYDGRTTLHSAPGQHPSLLLPLIPAEDHDHDSGAFRP